MSLGGLWDSWVNKETGEIIHTVSIITTKPNEMMQKIHNNPKASDGSRMPFILDREDIPAFFDKQSGKEYNKDISLKLIHPYPEEYLKAYTVPFITNKKSRGAGVGNSPKAQVEFIHERFDYRELLKAS
jgi:putative SOS response-associated peptidase YedK